MSPEFFNGLDTQVGGDHYKEMGIQPVQFIVENNIAWFEGNIIKYICRHRAKNGVEDLRKARHYLDMLIEREVKNGHRKTAQAD